MESTGEFDMNQPVLGEGGMHYVPFLAIGEGGMARVLLAKAKGPGGFEKLVVLKTIRRDALENPSIRRLFVDEARLCAQLNHPNLVQVHDVDLDAESPCLVMEYLEGKALQEILRAGALPQVMLLTVCSEVLAGLHYAHELRDFGGELMDVVHRDVSPQNLFVTYDGSAKVLDFGIAKMAGAVSDAVTEDVKGKLAYMAPEQLLGTQVDRRADLFAMGSLLWEIAVGRRMWDGFREPELMHRLATGDIPEVPPEASVDPELAAIIGKATAAEPSERYATALELRSDLDAYIASLGRRPPLRDIGEVLAVAFADDRERTASRIRLALSQRPIPSQPAEEPEEWPQRRSAAPWLLAIALAAGAVGWFVSTSEPPSATEAGPLDAAMPSDASGPSNASGLGHTAAQGTSAAAVGQGGGRGEETSAPRAPDDRAEQAPPSSSAPRTGRAAAGRRASPPTAQRPTTPSPASAPTPNCDPPYFFKDGIKSYRPECL